MKISLNWLRNHIDTDESPEEIAALLTSTGLEVESVEKVENVKGGLEGLVIGEVLTCEKHPDADKLKITTVNVGTATQQIVCGAPNVAVGQKVVVALPNTTIFPTEGESFTIKKAKIRGVESLGMICAEDEIGLGKGHDGILILPNETKIGTLAKDFFNIQTDVVFEIGLTPNRIDAASHFGVARDLKAVLAQRKNKNLKLKTVLSEIEKSSDKKIDVEIKDEDACKRYSSVYISNVHVSDSPEWLKNKLMAIGLRPINNIVDITNYVLHDLGQPLHAFDADKISGGKVIVRPAKKDSVFTTLDEVKRKMSGEELMICDAEKEMCIAGIFGGMESGVTTNTKNIFLESAWFNPTSIRKTAKKFGLNTDASFRFERGADIEMTVTALKIAAAMICEIAGGKIASAINDLYPIKFQANEIELRWQKILELTGQSIPEKEVISILENLDFEIKNNSEKAISLLVPSYRVDVLRECDVIEEILRIYGYNEIALPEKMSSSISFSKKNDPIVLKEMISNFLSAKGFHEILTNSLTSSAQEPFKKKEIDFVQILNPLSSELDVLRNSLLLNGLQSIAYNINRQQYDLKFYEFGKIYAKSGDKYIEENHISIFITGRKQPEKWGNSNSSTDFFEIKGIVESLFEKTGLIEKCKVDSLSHSILQNGLSYSTGKKQIASIGKANKTTLKFADIKQEVYLAEIYFENLLDAIQKVKIQATELPKFPQVRRDLSLLLDEKIKFSELENIARGVEKTLIKSVNLFDVYEGKNLEAGKKSYAISFTLYNEEATLTDIQVEEVMQKVIGAIAEKTGAVLR